MILIKDIQRAMLNGEQQPWHDLKRFCRQPLIVPESQGMAKLFEMMRISRAHITCVVDEYGNFSGIVTFEDLLEDLLEEIVGEIHDETDDAQTSIGISKIDDNNWEAHGLFSISDLERKIDLKIVDALEVNTLSGLLMLRLGRMPKLGDEITEGDFKMVLTALDGRRALKIHIHRVAHVDLEAENS